MAYLFTSESVSEGHPDKVADQISDALLDEFLRRDPESKVAVETLVTTGLTVISGEVKTNVALSNTFYEEIVQKAFKQIGYPEIGFERGETFYPDEAQQLTRDIRVVSIDPITYRIKEVPITFADRINGVTKMSKNIVLEAIWKVWWMKFKI